MDRFFGKMNPDPDQNLWWAKSKVLQLKNKELPGSIKSLQLTRDNTYRALQSISVFSLPFLGHFCPESRDSNESGFYPDTKRWAIIRLVFRPETSSRSSGSTRAASGRASAWAAWADSSSSTWKSWSNSWRRPPPAVSWSAWRHRPEISWLRRRGRRTRCPVCLPGYRYLFKLSNVAVSNKLEMVFFFFTHDICLWNEYLFQIGTHFSHLVLVSHWLFVPISGKHLLL